MLITQKLISGFDEYLRENENSASTISKYISELHRLLGRKLDKATLLEWKHEIAEQYAPATVNCKIAAVNGFLTWVGRQDLKLKPLKLQRTLFLREERELTRDDYARLVAAAHLKKNERLMLVLQTICATGIRVSELRFITVEAVNSRRAGIENKGKRRVVFLPKSLCKLLTKYIRKQKKTAGPVFTTRTGRTLDRSNIWRDMKALCDSAGVEPQKVFPHNLRHLFARTFYAMKRDLGRLADLLGHSNINTTRIYTAESGAEHARLIESLRLVMT